MINASFLNSTELQAILKPIQNQSVIYYLSLRGYNQGHIKCCHRDNYLNVNLQQTEKDH